MKIVTHALFVSAFVCMQSCGTTPNPFAKKDKPKPSTSMVELLSESQDVTDVSTLLVDAVDATSELGAYLTTGPGEQQDLQLVDFQRPDTPFTIGVPISGSVRKAILFDFMLIILDGSRAIDAYSIADRANPQHLASVKLPLSKDVIHDVTFIKSKQRLYFSTELSGILSVKIDEKKSEWLAEPLHLPANTPGPFRLIHQIGNHLVTTSITTDRLLVLELANELAVKNVSSYVSGGKITKLRSIAGDLYLCDLETGLHKLNLRDLANPTAEFQLRPEGIVRDVALINETLAVASDAIKRDLGIEFYRLRPDQSPQHLYRYPTTGVVESLQEIGNLLYAVDNRDGKKSLMIMRLNI